MMTTGGRAIPNTELSTTPVPITISKVVGLTMNSDNMIEDMISSTDSNPSWDEAFCMVAASFPDRNCASENLAGITFTTTAHAPIKAIP